MSIELERSGACPLSPSSRLRAFRACGPPSLFPALRSFILAGFSCSKIGVGFFVLARCYARANTFYLERTNLASTSCPRPFFKNRDFSCGKMEILLGRMLRAPAASLPNFLDPLFPLFSSLAMRPSFLSLSSSLVLLSFIPPFRIASAQCSLQALVGSGLFSLVFFLLFPPPKPSRPRPPPPNPKQFLLSRPANFRWVSSFAFFFSASRVSSSLRYHGFFELFFSPRVFQTPQIYLSRTKSSFPRRLPGPSLKARRPFELASSDAEQVFFDRAERFSGNLNRVPDFS